MPRRSSGPAPRAPRRADAGSSGASKHAGSWWPHWLEWIKRALRRDWSQRPPALGNARHTRRSARARPLCDGEVDADQTVIEVGGQTLRVGIRAGDKARTPLLAVQRHRRQHRTGRAVSRASWQGPETIVFDVPGVGGSPRPSCRIVRPRWRGWPRGCSTNSDYEQVDVLGVSWGGALAQQFAFQQSAALPPADSRGDLAGPSDGAGQDRRAAQDGDTAPLQGSRLHEARSPPTSTAARSAVRPRWSASICAMCAGRAITAITCS